MAYYSKEQIAKAKEMDLLSYLSIYEPHELVRVNRNTYTTVTHDSLIISNGMWNWFSQHIGGKTALEYLIQVKGFTFLEAVEKILKIAPNFKPNSLNLQTKKEKLNRLILPLKNSNNNKARSYLISRGIDADIIDECIDNGLIYEDSKNHNVVFVGMDKQNIPRYACSRGTSSKRFMREESGSDKEFSFRLLAGSFQKIHLFESAIDLLSYATLLKLKGHRWYEENFISLGGVYKPSEKLEDYKIPIALKSFLKNNEVDEIILHFDNDATGRLATKALKNKLSNKYTVIDEPPKIGKDFNDFLLFYKRNLVKNDREKER